MRDTDALAFFDALPPDERAALDAAVAAEPANDDIDRVHVRHGVAADGADVSSHHVRGDVDGQVIVRP